jgi:hypothetical protein
MYICNVSSFYLVHFSGKENNSKTATVSVPANSLEAFFYSCRVRESLLHLSHRLRKGKRMCHDPCKNVSFLKGSVICWMLIFSLVHTFLYPFFTFICMYRRAQYICSIQLLKNLYAPIYYSSFYLGKQGVFLLV